MIATLTTIQVRAHAKPTSTLALTWCESDLRPQINSLIAVELRKLLPPAGSKPTNLDHLNLPPVRPVPSANDSLFGTELARVQAGKPIPAGKGLDTRRYALPAPSGKNANNLEAWEQALKSSLSQLEHQRLRLMNANLMNQYGANAWRVQNFSVENMIARLERDATETRQAIEQVNRERKRSQEGAGEVLNRLEKRWTDLISGNIQLEVGCMTLENQVLEMHAKEQELRQRIAQLEESA